MAEKIKKSIKQGGADVFKWIKGPRAPPLAALREKDNPKKIWTQPKQMHAALEKAWSPIFNVSDVLDWQKFKERFGKYIKHAECELPQFQAEDLKKSFKRMNHYRSMASDEFTVPELRDLPLCILQLPAHNFRMHEAGMEWPPPITLGMVTALGKEITEDANVDPTDLTSPWADETRPITNLSVLYTAWDMARYEHRSAWREGWMSDSMHGARQEHEIFHVSWPIALKIEQSTLEKLGFSGSSLDRKKFFDLLRHEICSQLLRALGKPEPLIKAEEKFYQQLSCRFKIGSSVSRRWTRNRGYVQGASSSSEAGLALMSIWTAAVEEETKVSVGGFVDDCNIFANDEHHTQRVAAAMEISKNFDELAGSATNEKKTKVYASSPEVEEELKRLLQNVGEFNYVKNFVLVGSEIVARGPAPNTKRKERACKARSSAEKISHLPLSVERKAEL